MKKHTIVLLALLFSTFQAEAQHLQVTSFETDFHDLTAGASGKKDMNGDPCGLVRVEFAGGDMTFEGNVMEVKKAVSEYLVWMMQGSRWLTIKVPGYLPLQIDFTEKYGLEKGIQSKYTYVMVIEDSQNSTPDDTRNRDKIMEMIMNYSIAFEKKEIAYLEKIFSKDASIITCKKVHNKDGNHKFVYNKMDVKNYLNTINRVFNNQDRIKLNDEILSITRHPNNYYSVRVKQNYKSSKYSDEGYLFLAINFFDELKPTIDVRAWQPIDIPEKDLLTIEDVKPYLRINSSLNSPKSVEKPKEQPKQQVRSQPKEQPKVQPQSQPKEQPREQTTTATIMVANVDKDIPLTTAKNPNILAVIIGNEKYSKLPDVPYAENDAKMFKEYCEKTLGVTKEHIKYLPNAGYVDIYDAVEWLKKGTDSYSGEASVLFYYAGHGLPDPKTAFQYLVPADVDGNNLNLTVSLQELYDKFGQMPARSVTVFLDACFTGANRDNQMVIADNTKGARLAFGKSKPGTPSGKTVIFSATQDNETAHPFEDQKHGFFTYFLLCKLQESKGNATLGEIADYVTKNVKRAVFDKIQVSQTPSVSSSSNFGNDWRQMKLK